MAILRRNICTLLWAYQVHIISCLSLDSLSPQLSTFLTENMDSCLIKVTFGSNQFHWAKSLNLISNHLPFASFSVRYYIKHDQQSESNEEFRPNTVYFQINPYEITRFTSCYAHLYLIESQGDLESVRFYFLEADYNHEDPNIILFWDNTPSHIQSPRWTAHFTSVHLFKYFRGMRFFIKQALVEGEQQVGLICMICLKHMGSQYPVISYFHLNLPTPKNIQKMWSIVYRNHHHLNIPHICGRCKTDPKTGRRWGYGPYFVEFFVHEILKEKYNITSSEEWRRLLNQRGMITKNLYFPGSNVQTFFLSIASPRYIIAPYAIEIVKYQMITIIDESLIHNTWIALLEPFKIELWIPLLASYITMAILVFGIRLRELNLKRGDFSSSNLQFITKMVQRVLLVSKKTTEDATVHKRRIPNFLGWKANLSDSILWVGGALLDQHHRKAILKFLSVLDQNRILIFFLCWTWICFIMNSAYKGEVYSRLSSPREPSVPTDIETLAESDHQILTGGSTFATMHRNPIPRSIFLEYIDSLTRHLDEISPKNLYVQNLKRIQRNAKFTPIIHFDLGFLMKYAIVLVENQLNDTHVQYNRMNMSSIFVMVDDEKAIANIRFMFQKYTNKWISRPYELQEFPMWHPWLIQKTYFANLFMPVIAQWFESGLSELWDKRALVDRKKFYEKGILRSSTAKYLSLEPIVEADLGLKRLTGQTLLPTYHNFLCMIAICGIAGLAEGVWGILEMKLKMRKRKTNAIVRLDIVKRERKKSLIRFLPGHRASIKGILEVIYGSLVELLTGQRQSQVEPLNSRSEEACGNHEYEKCNKIFHIVNPTLWH